MEHVSSFVICSSIGKGVASVPPAVGRMVVGKIGVCEFAESKDITTSCVEVIGRGRI
jgi:hypothetical protein